MATYNLAGHFEFIRFSKFNRFKKRTLTLICNIIRLKVHDIYLGGCYSFVKLKYRTTYMRIDLHSVLELLHYPVNSSWTKDLDGY